MNLENGAIINQYKILSPIGKGGMGEVFLAQDTKLDRKVALKILPPEFAADKDRMSRFVREAKSASALNHPNIITIYEINEFENTHFMATEFIDGKTLNKYAKDGSLNYKSTLEIAIQVVSALDDAHTAGIVHRDIKPDNIMVRANGLVKILDFGIAKLTGKQTPEIESEEATAIQIDTMPGMIIGTANYMSPEQARGLGVDHQTDIFSFGVVLYKMLSGASPFKGATVSDVIAAVLTKEAKPLENIPPELAAIVQKSLQKEKQKRYQTAKDLLGELKEIKQELEIQNRIGRNSAPNVEEPPTQILQAPATAEKSTGSTTDSEEGFRVAVLPFKYRGANADLEDLAEGLSEEIITGLSRFSYLRVIARGLTLNYTGDSGDVRAVGKELGARYVLEGNLRQSGATVRIAAQLVDTMTGAHLWAETYDRALNGGEIFAIQDELVPRIVSTIADQHGVLVHSMMDAIRKKDKNQITPSDAVMSVFSFHERVTPENHIIVRDVLEHIVRQFPNEGNCWAMLETLYCDEVMFGFNPRPDPLGRALNAAERAVETAPTSNLACQALAQAHFFRREFEAFRPLAERTIALNPMDGATMAFMGVLIACSGEWERGCQVTDQAMRLNPHFPGWYRLAVLFDAYRQSDYHAALGEAEKINLPNYFWTLVMRTASLGQLGELEKARAALKELLASRPDFTKAAPEEFGHWFDAELVEHLMDGLRKAGLQINSAPNQEEQKTQILQAVTTAETESQNSIAVLPFTNISADEDNEYFCDGLAEELLNALSKIEDLKVAARTSAFSFKGKNTEAREIGEKLNVKNVLEGSVRRSGNKLRISVQLVNAADGYHLWSERYDREMQDIFDVQDEISLAVVDALKLKLFSDEKDALLKRYTNNSKAYQLYLKGRFYFGKFTVESFGKSVEYYEQALAIEPDYAPAYAALSVSYICFWYLGFGETAEYVSKAQAAVSKALALDQSLAEAYFALALVKFNYERNWTEAEKAFRRGIELNPSYAENYEHYGMFLAVMGRFDEAIAVGNRALELAPLALKTIYIAGWAFWFAGQPDLAREQGEKLLEMEPNFSGGPIHLGISLWKEGAYRKSLNALETAVKLGGGNEIKMLLGLLYGIIGERGKANHLLAEFQQLDEQGIFTASHQAFICAGLGEMDCAFVLLEQASERREGVLVFLKQFSSLYHKFHNDFRMTNLLNRLGLPTDKSNQTDESLEAKTATLTSSELKTELPADAETQSADSEPTAGSTTNPQSAIRNPKLKWWLFGLLGLIVLGGGFFGYKYFSPTDSQINSIAVLPFENKSSDADTDYLSDGLAESLTYRLSQLPDLKVSPTSSVFRYKGKETDPKIIAKELGVDSVMIGKITQRGDNLNISVSLVDTINGKTLWGEQYARKMSELLATQREIAIEITNNLKLKLSGESEQKLAKKYTDNNEAYQLYLKGNFYASQYTKESLAKGSEYYNQAIAIDPNFALAYNGLAYYYIVAVDFYLSPSDSMPKARAAAKRALEIDETLADAHTSLAVVLHWYDWDWAAAEKEFRRAIELNPNDSRTRQDYSWFLAQVGRFDEAVAEGKKAQQLDPLSPEVGIFLGQVFNFARRNEEAIEQLRKTVELDSNYWVAHDDLGRAYEQKGDLNQALTEYQRARQLEKNVPEVLALVGRAYALMGKKAEAQKVIDELKELSKRIYVPSYNFAIIYAGLGNKDEAFAYLNRAYDERSYYLTWLKVDSQLDNLRSDPRFKELVKKVGFPA